MKTYISRRIIKNKFESLKYYVRKLTEFTSELEVPIITEQPKVWRWDVTASAIAGCMRTALDSWSQWNISRFASIVVFTAAFRSNTQPSTSLPSSISAAVSHCKNWFAIHFSIKAYISTYHQSCVEKVQVDFSWK